MESQWMAHRASHYWLLVVACVVCVFFSTYKLSEAPGIWYDEGYFTQMSMNLAEHGQEVIQVAPGEYVSSASATAGFPLTGPVALSYRLFGSGVLQGRAVMAMYILLLVAASYVLARLLFGAELAAWTALLLVTLPLLYGNGKSVLGEIPGLFFLMATLLALVRLQESEYKSLQWYGLSGLLAGVCIATKPIFILLVPAVFIVFLFRIWRIRIRWTGFFLALASFLIPVGTWLHMQFGGGDTFAHILSFYVNPYDISNLATSVLHNAFLFISDTTPLYTLALLLVWLAFIIVRARKGLHISDAEMVALVFALLIVAAFLRLPGWYRYIFPALITSLFFLAPALTFFTTYLVERFSLPRVSLYFSTAAIVLLCLMQTYETGFSSYVASYYGAHRTRDVQKAFISLNRDSGILFYNVPELVILWPGNNYRQYLQPHSVVDAETYGIEQLDYLKTGDVEYVIVATSYYRSHEAEFSLYREHATASRYTILERV